MNIVFIISSLEKCGPVNVLYNIIKYLDKNKFNATIITLSNENANTRKMDFESLGVKIHLFSLGRNIFSLLGAKKKLENLLNHLNADIVHTHGIRADVLGAFITGKFKTVSTIHNYPFEDYVMAYDKILGNIMALLNFLAFKRIYMPVACSESINKKFITNWKSEFQVIQNGIDLEIYQIPGEEEKNRGKLRLNIDESKKVFLYLGALIKRKDPLFVIDVFQNNPDFNDCVLLMVGNGELFDLCKEKTKTSSNIRILGQVSNPELFYKVSDYYISASKAEGLPMAVLEAFASGLPAVLSDIDPHKEILRYDSQAGEEFVLGSKEDFHKNLSKLVASDYSDRSIAANRIIKEHLSAEIMSKNYQKLFVKLINNKLDVTKPKSTKVKQRGV